MPRALRHDPLTALLVGTTAGLVASFAMNEVQSLAGKVNRRLGSSPQPGGDPATVKAAEAGVHVVTGHRLPDASKAKADMSVHYLTGAGLGALFGLLCWQRGRVSIRDGLGYGSAVWALLDEVAVPLMGFSPPPQDVPALSHANAFGSHLVFGGVLGLAHRAGLAFAKHR